jgi:hypothetical protein
MSDTLTPDLPRGFAPRPVSSRVFVRCYRHYGDAKCAYDQLSVVARIPDKRMTVVARGLEWREPLSAGRLLKLSSALAAAVGAVVGLILWALGFTTSGTGWLAQTLLGALAGALTGVAETGHVEPRQYDILVEEDLAPRAREVLGVD